MSIMYDQETKFGKRKRNVRQIGPILPNILIKLKIES